MPEETTGREGIGPGVTGTGVGTAQVGGGLEVGTDTTLGKILVLASPLTSVVVGGLTVYLQASWGRYLEARQAAKARKTLQRAIDNDRLPDADRERFRQLLADLEHGVVARDLERVGLVGTIGSGAAD